MKTRKVATLITIIVTILMCIPIEAFAWLAQDVPPVYEPEPSNGRLVISGIMVGIIIVIIVLSMVIKFIKYSKKEENQKEKDFSEQR